VSVRRDQSAELNFVVTNTLMVGDFRSSVAFYRDVLGATVLRGRADLSATRQHLVISALGESDTD
jgi:hypothetical protein